MLHILASTQRIPRNRTTVTCELSYYSYDPSGNSNLPWQEDVEPDTGTLAPKGRDESAPRPWRIAPASPPEGVCRCKARPVRGWAGLASQGTMGRVGRPN